MNAAIVVPCYNEAARWNGDYWTALFSIKGASWILVDDGSTDSTHDVLMSHVQSGVEVLRLDQNVGKGEAVRVALKSLCEGSHTWAGFVDADGAFTANEIQRFAELTESAKPHVKAVWSSRVRMRGRNIQRSASRHAVGRTIATALSLRYPLLPYDSQAGLKLFRVTDEFAGAMAAPFRTRWLFDVELFARLEQAYGSSSEWLWEEPLDSWQHIDGSKISGRELMRIPVEMSRLLTRKG